MRDMIDVTFEAVSRIVMQIDAGPGDAAARLRAIKDVSNADVRRMIEVVVEEDEARDAARIAAYRATKTPCPPRRGGCVKF